jgi:pimeloyl-[acyl-carrier protein] methyl ester esterase
MTLRARISGAGPDMVFLHGWALHGGVWRHIARELGGRYRVTLLDLPGHGRSGTLSGDYTLPRLAEVIAGALPRRCRLVGWSLGGMVALQLALGAAADIERLVLVDSTPQFVATEAWPFAIEAAVFDGFAAQLKRDYRATLQRFLALQVLTAEGGRATLSELKEQMTAMPPPDPHALEGGLDILRHASLVSRLAEVRVPVTLIQGERDTLVPASAARAMAQRLPRADLHLIEGAGHAPFISHPQAFLSILEEIDGA